MLDREFPAACANRNGQPRDLCVYTGVFRIRTARMAACTSMLCVGVDDRSKRIGGTAPLPR